MTMGRWRVCSERGGTQEAPRHVLGWAARGLWGLLMWALLLDDERLILSTSSFATTTPLARSTSEVNDVYTKVEASLSRQIKSRASLATQHTLSTLLTGSTRSLPPRCVTLPAASRATQRASVPSEDEEESAEQARMRQVLWRRMRRTRR